jgi:hypothetical protein
MISEDFFDPVIADLEKTLWFQAIHLFGTSHFFEVVRTGAEDRVVVVKGPKPIDHVGAQQRMENIHVIRVVD